MPRPNRPRRIGTERALARRIAFERESRDLTYDRLASRMEEQGCPIQPSALFRIEKGDPPRRVTVDELDALSRVFGIRADRLLLPPEAVASAKVRQLVDRWHAARQASSEATQADREATAALMAYIEANPELSEPLAKYMQEWASESGWTEVRQGLTVAHEMYQLTGDESWKERMQQITDEYQADARGDRGER